MSAVVEYMGLVLSFQVLESQIVSAEGTIGCMQDSIQNLEKEVASAKNAVEGASEEIRRMDKFLHYLACSIHSPNGGPAIQDLISYQQTQIAALHVRVNQLSFQVGNLKTAGKFKFPQITLYGFRAAVYWLGYLEEMVVDKISSAPFQIILPLVAHSGFTFFSTTVFGGVMRLFWVGFLLGLFFCFATLAILARLVSCQNEY